MPSWSTCSSTRFTCKACVSVFRVAGTSSCTRTNSARCCSYSSLIRAASVAGGATLSRVRNFRPFHWIGLCDAVATTPASAPVCLTIIATPGVVTTSRSITSTPLAPSAAAAASRTQKPLGRESRPNTTRKCLPLAGSCDSFSHAANAAAMRATTGGVSVPPTVPRMPETPIINASMRPGPSARLCATPVARLYYSGRMDHEQLRAALDESAQALVDGTARHPQLAHLNRVYLPSREAVKQIVKRLRQLCFPGYFGEHGLTSDQLPERTRRLVHETGEVLFEQVRYCLRYRESIAHDKRDECVDCDERARDILASFFKRLPDVRELAASDVAAAFEG